MNNIQYESSMCRWPNSVRMYVSNISTILSNNHAHNLPNVTLHLSFQSESLCVWVHRMLASLDCLYRHTDIKRMFKVAKDVPTLWQPTYTLSLAYAAARFVLFLSDGWISVNVWVRLRCSRRRCRRKCVQIVKWTRTHNDMRPLYAKSRNHNTIKGERPVC